MLWSDACVPQNRNLYMTTALINFLNNKKHNVSTVEQKFQEPGHSCVQEVNAIHSTIDKAFARAERNVRTLKTKLNAMNDSNLPIRQQLREILFRYRATPLAYGRSPAELYLNRQIRTRLDAFVPRNLNMSSNKQSTVQSVRKLAVGERVQARWYPHNKQPTWRFGEVASFRTVALYYYTKW